MRRTSLSFLAMMLICVFFFAKGPDTSASSSTGEKIISIEKQLWEAWKNKDGGVFDANLSPEAVNAFDSGILDKADTVKDISSGGCDVKDYSLGSERITWLNKTTALLTYKVLVHATCNGQPVPEHIIVGAVYVKRGGKWLQAFHQETPAASASQEMRH